MCVVRGRIYYKLEYTAYYCRVNTSLYRTSVRTVAVVVSQKTSTVGSRLCINVVRMYNTAQSASLLSVRTVCTGR
jgi:hypothetical protein